MDWMKLSVAVVAAVVGVWLDVSYFGATWLSALVEGAMFGVGVTFLIFGSLLVMKARRSTRLPFVAVCWLLLAPFIMHLTGAIAMQYVFQLLSIASVLVLGWEIWQQINSGAERRDDDVKRGGFEV
jgi:hypothetical protein